MAQINDVLMLNIIATTNQAMKPINDVNKALEDMTKKTTIQRSALVGLGMAFLFGGMAMKRFFGSALRGIWNTYKEIIDVNDQFFQATQRLNAAWTFFKFSLIDALSQSPLMMNLLEMLIQFINWLGQLSSEQKILFVEFLIGAFVVVAALSVLGQAILFIGAIIFVLGAATALTFLTWATIIGALIAFFIIFRVRIITNLFMIGSAMRLLGWEIRLAFVEAFIWVADKAVAFVNTMIGLMNRILPEGMQIGEISRPGFLDEWKAGAEAGLAEEQGRMAEAGAMWEEGTSIGDVVGGIKDMYNELKDLKASLDKIVDNTSGSVVVPSTSQ